MTEETQTETEPVASAEPAPLSDVHIFFQRVDALRRQMLLTMDQMAKLFGVSRVTYIGWTKGKKVRKGNLKNAKEKVKQLLVLIEEGWPEPQVVAATSDQRYHMLLERMPKEE